MSPTCSYQHLEGPLGDLIASLDLFDAGLLGFITRLSAVRKQAALCVLAHSRRTTFPPHHTEALRFDHSLIGLAKDIRGLKPAELLTKHLAPFHDGLIGALAKLGQREQPSALYRSLVEIFRDPTKAPLAATVRHLQSLTAERLTIIEVLAAEPAFLAPRWVEKITTVQEAKDVIAATRMLREQVFEHFDEDAFRESVRDTGERTSIAAFFRDWFSFGDRRIQAPIDLGPRFEPLDTLQKLTAAGFRWKLCLSNLETAASVMSLRRFYWFCPRREVIVEAEAHGGTADRSPMWFAGGLFGPSNSSPSPSVRREIESDLARAGLALFHAAPEPSFWDAVTRLAYAKPLRTDNDGDGDADDGDVRDILLTLQNGMMVA